MSDYVRGLREKIGHELLLGPAAAALVRAEGRILLVKSTEGKWMLPGGAVDPGETPADAARREAWEEAGVVVEPLRIAGVFGGPEYRHTYPNGDELAYVTTVFEARLVDGVPRPDGEETEDAGWFSVDELAALPMSLSTQTTLRDLFAGVSFRPAQPPSEPTR